MIRYVRVSLTLFLLGMASPLQAVSLDEIDLRYKESKTVAQLLDIEPQVVESIRQSPQSDEWMWRLARIYYGLGKRSAGDAKENYFVHCLEWARRTLELNKNSAHGYFFNGLCNGKRGEILGVWASLELIEPMEKDMRAALRIDPSIEHGGPHRFLGRLYYELPFILGGSLDKSIDHLQKAVQYGPRFGENYLYLAESYFSKGENDLARKNLLELLDITHASQADPEIHDIRTRASDLLGEIETF